MLRASKQRLHLGDEWSQEIFYGDNRTGKQLGRLYCRCRCFCQCCCRCCHYGQHRWRPAAF